MKSEAQKVEEKRRPTNGPRGVKMNYDQDDPETLLPKMSSAEDLEYNLTVNGSYAIPATNDTIKTLLCVDQFKNLSSELSGKVDFCNATSDTILCWPPTPLNTTAFQRCFSEFNDLRYDDTRTYRNQTAYRFHTETWAIVSLFARFFRRYHQNLTIKL